MNNNKTVEKRTTLFNAYKKGSTTLVHRYLDDLKTFIDKQVLIDSGVKLVEWGENDNALMYGVRTLTESDLRQYQVIHDVKDGSNNFIKRTHCSAGNQPVFQPIGGKLNLNDVKYIVLAESLTKAAAIHQSILPEGELTACVLNCLNVGNMAKVANLLSSIDDIRDKLVIAADSDQDEFHKIIRKVAEEKNIKIFKPANGFKDVDDWYGSNVQFAGEEIFDAIQTAKPLSINEIPTAFEYFSSFEGYDVEANYLIKKHIPDFSVGMLIGASGVYKSFLAISWSCHIATGVDWNGNKVKQAGVLYVVGEGGIGVPRRFKAWSDENYGGENIPYLFRINQPIHMADNIQWLKLVQTVEQIKKETGVEIKLIVLDTLARCFAGGDENRAADMGAFIGGCDNVKAKTGASILIVHHTGKDATKGARGSSTLKAACDFEYEVKRLNDHDSDLKEIVLKNYKMKDDETNKDTAYSLKTRTLYQDSDGEDVTSLILIDEGYEPPEDEIDYELTDNQQEVLEGISFCISAKGEVFYLALRDHLKKGGWDNKKLNNFKRTLQQLADKGKIKYNHETGAIKMITHSQ